MRSRAFVITMVLFGAWICTSIGCSSQGAGGGTNQGNNSGQSGSGGMSGMGCGG